MLSKVQSPLSPQAGRGGGPSAAAPVRGDGPRVAPTPQPACRCPCAAPSVPAPAPHADSPAGAGRSAEQKGTGAERGGRAPAAALAEPPPALGRVPPAPSRPSGGCWVSSSFFKSVSERSLPRPFPHHPLPCGHFSLDFSCNVFPLHFGVGHSLFGSSAVAIGNSSSSEATWEQFGHTPQEVAPPPPVPSSPKGRSGLGRGSSEAALGGRGAGARPAPSRGVTRPLWLVFLCLTPSSPHLPSLGPF